MRRFVFRSPRLGFLAVGPALARPTAAFYRRNRAAFAPFDPVQPEDFFTEEGQAERLAEELGWAEAGRSFRFLLVQPRHPGKIIGALGFNEIVRGAFQSCFVSYKEEGQAERLAEELGWAEAGRSFRFLLVQPRHPGKIIGALGFNEIVRGAFQSCFVSYKIDAALWGRGYGSEAIRYGTGWAFRVLGLHRAEANVMPRNAASLRAAEKAGYRPEGLARRYLNINGVWEDHIHMVKLNEEEYHA